MAALAEDQLHCLAGAAVGCRAVAADRPLDAGGGFVRWQRAALLGQHGALGEAFAHLADEPIAEAGF